MALLQVIDHTSETHNYKDKTVMGHDGRKDDAEIAQWYSKSVFNQADAWSADTAAVGHAKVGTAKVGVK